VRRASETDIHRNVILMGASLGGIQALGKILSTLPKNLGAAIAITLHRGKGKSSMLAEILGGRSQLELVQAENGQLFSPGRVYLAPPDYHLVFSGGLVRLDHGPKENHARPSIDAMFRSGAKNFGPRVIGVILTGNLSDGVAGLKAIKRQGGLSLAQEPAEAVAPSMPLHAVVYDHVDIVFQLAAGAEVLSRLVGAQGVGAALETAGARAPKDVPLAPDA
jgi:two-component system chemotaxis response regulator CheB